MATNPAFAATPRLGVVAATAANTNRDGTGTIVDVLTGVSTGTKIYEVTVEATVTTTAGMVRLYAYNGSTSFLVDEVAVTAVTPSASVAAFRVTRTYDNFVLPGATYKLQASTHNAETFNVFAFAGDL